MLKLYLIKLVSSRITMAESKRSKDILKKKIKTPALSCHLCYKVFGFRNNLKRHLNSGKCDLLCDESHEHEYVFRKFDDIYSAKTYVRTVLDPNRHFTVRNSRPKQNYFVYCCSKRDSKPCHAKFSITEHKPRSKRTRDMQSVVLVKGCVRHNHIYHPITSVESTPSQLHVIDVVPPPSSASKSSSVIVVENENSDNGFRETIDKIIENHREVIHLVTSLENTSNTRYFVEKLLLESSNNVSKLLGFKLCGSLKREGEL